MRAFTPDSEGWAECVAFAEPTYSAKYVDGAHPSGAFSEAVDAGVSVGIRGAIPVRAVRDLFGEEILLQIDAHTAYSLDDAAHLARLDPFGSLLIEQPLPEHDLRGHADLPRGVDRVRGGCCGGHRGDTSASDRYFREDLTEPLVLEDGGFGFRPAAASVSPSTPTASPP